MHLSPFVIGLLSTILGCRQFIELVAAFGRSPLLPSRISASTLSVALQTAEGEELEEDESSREELMDEAVLLYSVVSRRARFDVNTEAEQDILKLRAGELSRLVEDAVFDERGIVRDGIASSEDTAAAETTKEPETLYGISQALDDQILLGYEATFTEEELEKWIVGIESLQHKLQSQLAALPPGTDWTTEQLEASVPKQPTPLDKMHVRLETMRTLIDPEGNDRLRSPLAQHVVAPEAKPTLQPSDSVVKPDPVTPSPEATIENSESMVSTSKEESLQEEGPTSKLDIENAFIESINKAAASRSDTSSPIEVDHASIESTSNLVDTKEDLPTELELENALIESMNKAAVEESSTELELENALIESMNKAAGDDTPTELELENALIESMNKAAVEESPTELELENALFESMNKAATEDSPKEDSRTELELENALIESMNKAATEDSPKEDSPTEVELENAFFESMDEAATEDSPKEDSPTEFELENALIESMNEAATEDSPKEDSPTELELENALIESMNIAAGDDAPTELEHENGELSVTPKEGADVVSTVATTVALGAAAVTKLPLVLAGVALGPVIRDSISYAKGRTKKATESKETRQHKNLLEFKPKNKKKITPKARSAFDPKPPMKEKKKISPKSRSAFDPKPPIKTKKKNATKARSAFDPKPPNKTKSKSDSGKKQS